jgi:signal transduction histidine kinase
MFRNLLFLVLITSTCFNSTASANELDSLKRTIEFMPEDSLKCNAYLRISFLLYIGEEAERYAYQGLILAKHLNNTRLIAKSYHRLGWCHGLDEVDKKTAYLDSAAVLFTSINDNYGLGNVYDTKGVLLMNYGAMQESMISFQKAFDYFSKIPNAERVAGILNNWAIAEYTLGNTAEALKKYRMALDFRLNEKPLSYTKIARLYQGMGESHRIEGNLAQATENYLIGYQYRKDVENIGVAESLLSIASMIYEAAENGIDTTSILDMIKAQGFQSSDALIREAANTPGVSERMGLQYAIKDVKRQGHLVRGEYQNAYDLLSQLKHMDEEAKLSESSLEAMADMMVKFEKDQLNIKLLEEEVSNEKSKRQVSVLLFSLGGLFLLSIVGLLYYQNRMHTSKLELNEAHREQQIISMRSMLEGQEKERSRIARDLHDGLGNLLSTLKVNIGSLQINFDDNDSKKIYSSASEMIDEACTEVRKIAHEMMPQALKKLGLRKALEDLVFKMDTTHEFDAQFHFHGTEKTFDDHTNVMLFRIVQEALNNIIKYANASEVSVQVTYSDDWFDLSIEDDGIGFDPKAIDPEKGMGLKSIAFRTEFIGGSYDIDSREGAGTLVTINMPLNNAAKA